VGQHVFQLHSIHDGEDPFQQGFGHLKADEIVVLLRSVPILRDLDSVEAEFCFQVSRLVLGIADGLAIFRAEFGILDGDCLINRGVAGDIRCIVRQGAKRKGVLVNILTLEQQLANEVSAANVVHEVAEFLTAERIIAEILDDRPSIGISVGLFELIFRQSGKPLEQKGLDLIGPEQVDDFLVRKNGV
jgi:hypothetical protein